MMRILWRLLVVLLPAALAVSPLQAEVYRVGMADSLRLRVMEWQPIDGLVRDWPAMAGEYAVGADGATAFPFLGRLPVAGLTTDEISAAVSSGLKQRFALPEAPDVLVEIAAYRPVFVSGLVRDPGEFPFQPGLMVGQAISMAGGPAGENGRSAFNTTSYLNNEGQLDLFLIEDLRLRIRLARLEAERAGLTEFEMPADIPPGPRAAAIHADETEIMRLRAGGLERELNTMAVQKANIEAEIVTLLEKTALMDQQEKTARASYENVSSLVERGLAVQDRLSSAETRLANVQSQILDLSTTLLRARQSLVTLERDRLGRIDGRAVEVAQDHLSVASQIAENARRIETQRRILSSELIFAAPRRDGVSPLDLAVVIITRSSAEGTETLSAGMGTLLAPGDVIEMRPPEIEMPETP